MFFSQVVILGSVVGNSLFLWTLKRNAHLRRTPHLIIATLAVIDLIVTIAVVPFVIDSQGPML
jgi:hypothetical protein